MDTRIVCLHIELKICQCDGKDHTNYSEAYSYILITSLQSQMSSYCDYGLLFTFHPLWGQFFREGRGNQEFGG